MNVATMKADFRPLPCHPPVVLIRERCIPQSRIAFVLALSLVAWLSGAGPLPAISRATADGWTYQNPGADPTVWEIRVKGALVTTYHEDLEGTPGFFPLLTPQEVELTRQFPIGPARTFEKEDHDHHRSFWFTHGTVNGLDFWDNGDQPHIGEVVQRSVQFETRGDALILTTHNDWLSRDGNRILRDIRRFRFSLHHGDTLIDATMEMIADNGEVTLGDTKEGSFGVRVAGTMKVDAKKIDRRLGGQIVNAEGLKDAQAWSQKSDWVDYSGPLLPKSYTNAIPKGGIRGISESNAGGMAAQTAEQLLSQTLPLGGITMMYHPQNPLAECRWHVRTYGLFAANPFARQHFGLPEYEGVTIRDGERLTLDFRIVLHDGPFNEERARVHFDDYKSIPLPIGSP